jgi:hypothetical protein
VVSIGASISKSAGAGGEELDARLACALIHSQQRAGGKVAATPSPRR